MRLDVDSLMCKSDIWSVGVLIFVLAFGKAPFDGNTYSQLVRSIRKGEILRKRDKFGPHFLCLLNLLERMLEVDPMDRVDTVQALNHDFFKIEESELSKMKFKPKALHSLSLFWYTLKLKDAIKDYAAFVSSWDFLAAAFELIFESKEATNLKQVANGISCVTEDFTIAKYILDSGFPKGFLNAYKIEKMDNDESRKGSGQTIKSDKKDEHKINSHNITQYFLDFYTEQFEEQMRKQFDTFKESEQQQEALSAVRDCIM
jgi:serine/threonine protein kinase